MLSIVQNDLLLLENQLPWRVLDCLFHQVPGGKCKSLWELTQRVLPSWKGLEYFVSHVPNTLQSRHLLDTLRILSVEFESDKNEKVCPFRVRIPSATELLQVGVKFRRKRGFDSILNITLLDGLMDIAPITLDAEKSVFRNLIALEEYEPRHHKYQITSYDRVMHDLIKSSKDVEFLIQKGIINTISLRKEDIVYFFNTILDDSNTVSSCSSIVLLSAGVTEYYDHRWLRRWIASIKRDYLYNLSSIWSISNAVVFITILTIIQTVYSVLSYYMS
ncbi:UPF0481 protein At3g47200-like [Rosa rugosa]|uniref:UPF0481 protein At3g47200-like n=1 Tax=Rosa rugosa TaxID=74645 RepID=UPI002B40C341|nr:UPF0481 protein At3g47200-like [Rosa rugosa]